jgi:hypothetical protein
MEPIVVGIKSFIEEIVPTTTLTLKFLEDNWKKALEGGEDWTIHVGIQPNLYAIKLESIKAYFDAKNAPPAPPPPPIPLAKEFDFADDDELVPPAKGTKSVGKASK